MTWAIVCLVGMWLPPWCLPFVSGAGLLCFIAGAISKRLRVRRDLLLIAATVAISSMVLWCVEVFYYQPVARAFDTDVTVSAVVYSDMRMRILSGDLPRGVSVRSNVIAAQHGWQIGDVISGEFHVDVPDAHGLGVLQNKAYGFWGVMSPTDVQITEHRASTVITYLAEWRRLVAAEICRLLPQDVGAVIAGICLGEDGGLSAMAAEDFRACGVSHLFSVSGLHLSVLTQTLVGVLTSFRISRRVRGAVGAAAVVGFVMLMGPTASVVRAGMMCFLVMMGECFYRQADARNSMGLALILLLASDPFAVYDAGLLLSFLSTCGILFLAPTIREWLCRLPTGVFAKPWEYLSSAVSITLAASVTTLPVTMIYFGAFSIVGIVANPIITLPATVILIVGWIAVLLITLHWEWAYRPLLLLLGFISKGVLYITAILGTVQPSISATVWFLGSVVLVYGGYRLFRYHGVWITAAVSVGVLSVTSFLL